MTPTPRRHTIQRPFLFTILILSTACAQTELTDARLLDAGLNLGVASVALVQRPDDDTDADATSNASSWSWRRSSRPSPAFTTQLGLADTSLPAPASTPLPASGNSLLTWDGSELEADVDGLDGGDVRASAT